MVYVGDPLLCFSDVNESLNAILTVATPSAVTATLTMVDGATGMENGPTVEPAMPTTMKIAMPSPLCSFSMDGI